MKTFIINLESSTLRRRNIIEEATRQKLDYEIMSAVDGSLVTDEEFDRLPVDRSVREDNPYYTRTMIGAALSHARVYERIIESGVEMALVLEDDAVLCDGFSDILESIRSKIARNEVVVCHFMSFGTMHLSRRESEPLSQGTSLYRAVSLENVNSGAGYVITREAAASLLKTVIPIQCEADSWKRFYDQQGFESIRFVYPMPVRVRGDKSTIARERQSAFRNWLTSTIDEYRVPLFYHMLRHARLKSVADRSKVAIVDDDSELVRHKNEKGDT